jgi:hypothetical protein
MDQDHLEIILQEKAVVHQMGLLVYLPMVIDQMDRTMLLVCLPVVVHQMVLLVCLTMVVDQMDRMMLLVRLPMVVKEIILDLVSKDVHQRLYTHLYF